MPFDTDIAALVGLEEYLEAAPDVANQAMSMALNDVVGGRGLAQYRRALKKEINFPAGYVENSDRFGLDKRARPNDLTASIVARQRPTSLARFVTSGAVGIRGGVSVRVSNKGGSSQFKRGFLVRLKSGTSMDGSSNLGLAVRLNPGEVLNKRDMSNMVHLEANVVLLYGPSIDQVLNTSVADAETPEVADSIVEEFYRQYARLSND